MKKGFTMIELIFVIVILGILAAVAIPRLSATRDDAEMVKTATNLSTIISDLGAYYTSQGVFADDLVKMTNVPVDGTTTVDTDKTDGTKIAGPVYLTAAGKQCVGIELYAESSTDTKKHPSYIKVVDGADNTEQICVKVNSLESVKKIKKSEVIPQVRAVNTDPWKDDSAITGAYPVSGMSVKF